MRLEDKAFTKATEAVQERLDKEVKAAWRAGYDYLHVYEPLHTAASQSDIEAFKITYRVMPAYQKEPLTNDHAGVRILELPEFGTPEWQMLKEARVTGE